MSEDLGTYLGEAVTETGLIIRKTGDGLSKAMKIEPRVLEPGRYYVLLECEFSEHKHKLITNDEGDEWWRCTNVLDAGVATFLEADKASDAIEAQRAANVDLEEREKLAKELAKGTRRLPTADALRAEHDAGDHGEMVDGCPVCEESLAADAEFASREASNGDVTDLANRRAAKAAPKKRASKPKVDA